MQAFYDCDSFTSVTIPDSVTSIESGAFSGCDHLASFNSKFASADKRCLIIDGVLNCFAPAELTEYTIPDNVTSIGDSAFGSCTKLTRVSIPNSVTSIGSWAFGYCTSLTSIDIPNSVTMIAGGAFRTCESLTSITIPESVTHIGEFAFYNCSKLVSLYCKPTTPPNLKSINAFGGNANGMQIFVPSESIGYYTADPVWGVLAWKIAACNF